MPISSSRPAKMSAPPAKKGHGCLFWLAIAAGVALLSVAIIGMALWHQYRKLQAATSDKPQTIAVAPPSADMARTAQDKVTRLTEAVRRNTSDTFNFSGDELNALLATSPQLADVRGKTAFAIQGQQLSANVSLPLDALPGLQGRFLNAQVDVELTFKDGVLDLYLRNIRPTSGELPAALLSAVQSVNLGEQIRRNPEAAKALGAFTSIDIRDGQMVLVTRGGK